MKKEKTCIDCYYCKVSFSSTTDNRMCYCSIAKNKENQNETYWIKKIVCEDFIDMSYEELTA